MIGYSLKTSSVSAILALKLHKMLCSLCFGQNWGRCHLFQINFIELHSPFLRCVYRLSNAQWLISSLDCHCNLPCYLFPLAPTQHVSIAFWFVSLMSKVLFRNQNCSGTSRSHKTLFLYLVANSLNEGDTFLVTRKNRNISKCLDRVTRISSWLCAD